MASPIWINQTRNTVYTMLGLILSLTVGCTENKDTSTNDGPINSDTASTTETDTATEDSAQPDSEYGECGDGIVNSPTEECDDGAQNSNVADACRTDCLLPKCGDGIVDEDESCDDNNLWNVDGCDEDCQEECNTSNNDCNTDDSCNTNKDCSETSKDCCDLEYGCMCNNKVLEDYRIITDSHLDDPKKPKHVHLFLKFNRKVRLSKHSFD